jgi:hypothetical protein
MLSYVVRNVYVEYIVVNTADDDEGAFMPRQGKRRHSDNSEGAFLPQRRRLDNASTGHHSIAVGSSQEAIPGFDAEDTRQSTTLYTDHQPSTD